MADEGGVLDELRAAILAGEFVAGQRLVEVDLCERFGCGRFAVRAAIPVLASEGLVDVQRHRGARVRVIPLAEAVEMTEVRRLLEGLIAARAAERATRAEVAELRQVIKEMREAVSSAELMRYSDANARLHGLIRRIGAHQTATGILERLRAQMVRHQFTLALVPGRPVVSLAQHERIVAAIAARDPQQAEAAMLDHITSVIESLSSLQGAPPARPAGRGPGPAPAGEPGRWRLSPARADVLDHVADIDARRALGGRRAQPVPGRGQLRQVGRVRGQRQILGRQRDGEVADCALDAVDRRGERPGRHRVERGVARHAEGLGQREQLADERDPGQRGADEDDLARGAGSGRAAADHRAEDGEHLLHPVDVTARQHRELPTAGRARAAHDRRVNESGPVRQPFRRYEPAVVLVARANNRSCRAARFAHAAALGVSGRCTGRWGRRDSPWSRPPGPAGSAGPAWP